MNEELIKKADASYRLAEKKAADYFESLSVELMNKTYVTAITKNIQTWKQNHIHIIHYYLLFHVEKENLIFGGIIIISNG